MLAHKHAVDRLIMIIEALCDIHEKDAPELLLQTIRAAINDYKCMMEEWATYIEGLILLDYDQRLNGDNPTEKRAA